MHAVWLAEELDIGEVLVPWSPGTFSAWGMLQTDMRHDLAKTFYRPLAGLDAAEVAEVYERLEAEGRELLDAENVGEDEMYFTRAADMRYVGQEYSVLVDLAARIDLDEIVSHFHDSHRIRYGHSTPGAPVEFVNLRLAAFGRVRAGSVPYEPPSGDEDPVLGRRPVTFDGEPHETPVLLRPRLVPGDRRAGPVVIEEDSATTVVPPGYTIEVAELGDLVIANSDGRKGEKL
jgi:N-methylhydantoinase A